MKRYSIKCSPDSTEYIDILEEMDDEYLVRFIRHHNGDVKTTEESLAKHLFDICLKTGYLNPVPENTLV